MRLLKLVVVGVFATAVLAVGAVVIFVEVSGLVVRPKNLSQLKMPKGSNGGQVVLGNFAEENGSDQITGQVIGSDARVEITRRYLAKYHSPLLPQANLIVELADKYGFDYYWILAIGQQESNLCKKIPANSYNCWGYGINSAGTLRFESYQAALASYAEYLDREYFKKGRNTAELIMAKYCPHSNGSWAYGVNHFIEEIETGSFDL